MPKLIVIVLVLVLVLAPAMAKADDSDLIREIGSIVKRHSLAEVPEKVMNAVNLDELIQGMHEVDPFFSYRSPDEAMMADHLPATVLRGVGGIIVTDFPHVAIVPVTNGPAFQAGLTEPGYLEEIDGRPISADRFKDIPDLLAAGHDGRVDLTVRTTTQAPPAVVSISPGSYDPPDMDIMNRDRFSGIRIFEFVADHTATRLGEALRDLKDSGRPIVLDLRFSRGGSLFEALDAASLFLPAGVPLASTRDRSGDLRRFTSVEGRWISDGPIMVLVGPNTISAAESFARILEYYLRGLIVGHRTYGKCTSQGAYRLSNGATVILTNSVILDPGDSTCDGQGLMPEVVVETETLYAADRIVDATLPILTADRRDSVLCLDRSISLQDIPFAALEVRALFTMERERIIARPISPADQPQAYQICIGIFGSSGEASPWRERLRITWPSEIVSLSFPEAAQPALSPDLNSRRP